MIYIEIIISRPWPKPFLCRKSWYKAHFDKTRAYILKLIVSTLYFWTLEMSENIEINRIPRNHDAYEWKYHHQSQTNPLKLLDRNLLDLNCFSLYATVYYFGHCVAIKSKSHVYLLRLWFNYHRGYQYWVQFSRKGLNK